MRVAFDVGGSPAEVRRGSFTGRVELQVGDQITTLQSSLRAQFSVRLTKVWHHRAGSHEVVVEKKRPLFFAGLRAHAYRVFVDGVLVAEASG